MIEWNSALPKHEYDVQVGFMHVRVRGTSPDDAIQNARQKLCHEMPRMWDVIQQLSDSRFQVTCCESLN